MAVYYKFKSARDYDSIPMDGPFISVGTLKEKIFESKHLGRGTDFDLVVTNAQTNEEYLDEAMLIPKNTSVLIRRVPGRPRMPIVTEQEPMAESKIEDTIADKSNFTSADSSAMKYSEDLEWDEFGTDLYAIPETLPVQSNNTLPDAPPTNKADEDSKLKALIETPALDWQRQGADGFGPGRGFGRGMAGRMGGRGFGRLGLERKTPPQGYVCHRCKVPGHFIQHCPTNGDPNYDIKRVKPPTGIPKSMLMATPDGSYALPSGAVAVLKPNEAAFEKEIEGLPSTRSIGDLPPELHCPLCKEVMKDAVLTSKCCFKSFCDKCIRDHIISKSNCVCGATDILADDLLPNKTLRDTINRILESGNSSAENAGSTFQVQDMESARCSQPKIPSPTHSAASKGEQKPSPSNAEAPNVNMKETVNAGNPAVAPLQLFEKVKSTRAPDASEATHESVSVKEPASQGSAPLADEEVQQKLAIGDAGKKKKKKKVRMPPNDLWKSSQDLAAENYMMPMGPGVYNPYWPGAQPGMEGYMAPYANPVPFMGYGMNPLDMPFGGMMPPDPFAAQGFMMPVIPPQRDLADFGMGMNVGHPHPAMSREEFEAMKADMRRRRENERRAEREMSRDRDFGREVSSSGDVSSMKSKPLPPPSSSGGGHQRHRSERPSPDRPPRDLEPPPRPSKRKPDRHHEDHDHDRDRSDRDRDRDYDSHHERDREHHYHHHTRSEKAPSEAGTKPTSAMSAAERRKASVFSRISFPEGEAAAAKKRKVSSSSAGEGGGAHHKSSSSANGYYDDHKTSSSVKGVGRRSSTAAAMEYESSDDDNDRHFKRKPSRYDPSPPPPPPPHDDTTKHSSRASRERERKHR
ncbi:hypothetical protein K2173_020152 [Erythroxylum novogranatense]|uniref:DWNN domain-containing protein n=1 Tax=Erythroxylum novogranatense TaxID=1862640 RepID=A0AAV8UA19_9ROSI|nr:hypothetical protein K2173_020152 [Erythroxylum novogranatense]